MLFLLVSFLSFFVLLIKPLPRRLPSWASEMRLLCVLLCQEFSFHVVHWLKSCRLVSAKILSFSLTAMLANEKSAVRSESVEVRENSMVLLDLPELALELVLEKLSPAELLKMAGVCSYLREKCRSDHLWERHFREKWRGVVGEAARRAWELHPSSTPSSNEQHRGNHGLIARGRRRSNNLLLETMYNFWPRPLSWGNSTEIKRHLPAFVAVDSIMALYLALQSGRFSFPAQVYNREQNGHVGFMLSCYDAELSYDSRTDTFRARYPPHGQRAMNVEEGVQWERLRAPPVDTSPHDLHISECLNELRPGDHFEIQWRRNKEFPYGWWYGVVGHSEPCDGAEHHCRCHNSDKVTLEFKQYSPGSRWRKTAINRKDHREEGNELDGFYGGVRKLYREHEISIWKQLWPTEVLG